MDWLGLRDMCRRRISRDFVQLLHRSGYDRCWDFTVEGVRLHWADCVAGLSAAEGWDKGDFWRAYGMIFSAADRMPTDRDMPRQERALSAEEDF